MGKTTVAALKRGAGLVFPNVDSHIRGRLRSALRKRTGRRGRGRGNDRQRWRNHGFNKLGLFNLTQAHALARKSSC